MTARDTYKFWLKNVAPSEKVELMTMNDAEITDAFSGPLSFGTAGMRGIVGAGTYRMNVYTVRAATAGVAEFIVGLGKDAMSRGVVISYDTRRFSKEFARATAAVFAAYGVKTYIFEDVRPVPVCSFAIRHLNAVAGVMITASHNPKEYNGYKLYGEDGAQMSPENTAEVVKFIEKIDNPFTVKSEVFPATTIEGRDEYQLTDNIRVIGKTVDEAYYKEIVKLALSPKEVAEYGKKLRLVYTPVHGAGFKPVTEILSRLGINATIVAEQAEPDTEFSTVPVPNPESASTLQMGMELADKIRADVVIGTDPDCDRMGVAVRDFEGKFRLLTGNQIGVLLLDYVASKLKENGDMPENAAAVRSFVSTTLADKVAEYYGVQSVSVPTGFKFIGEKIKEWEKSGEYTYIFGFEESFGSLRGTHARDKDAVVASMLFSELCCYLMSKGESVYGRLTEIFKRFGWYTELNKTVQYKGFNAMTEMSAVLDKLRAEKVESLGGYDVVWTADYLSGKKVYADGTEGVTGIAKNNTIMYGLPDGRFACVRPSGTEPKLKLYALSFADGEEASIKSAENVISGLEKLLG